MLNKIGLSLMFALFLISSVSVTGQGMDFFHGTFEEALELAKKEDKAVFVDAYTTWCGPCKRMSKNVFPQKIVGDYYNANFINMKLNMEKEPGMKFKLKYPVSAYPTFYFISPDGEVLYTTKGGRQAEQFIGLGKTALLKYDRTSEFAKLYDNGDRSYETILSYVRGLNKSGKSSQKIVNDHLLTQDNLGTKENLMIIYEGMTTFDSKIYDLYIKYKAGILKLVDQDDYDEKVRKVADKTVLKAIEFKEETLLKEAQEKRADHLPKEAKEFNITSKIEYAIATKNSSDYLKYSKKYAKKFAKNAVSKNGLVEDAIKNFPKNKKIMNWAADLADDAIEQGGLADYYLNYAHTQYHLGNNEKALIAADKALKLANEQKSDPRGARALISLLKM